MHVRLAHRCGGGAARVGDLEALAGRVARDRHDRMQQQMDLAVAAIHLRGDGVDEEWHVVVHDLDDGVLEVPAVLVGGGIEEADVGLAGIALRAELPERQSAAEEGLEGGVDHVVGRDVGEVAAHEMLDAIRLIGGNAAASFRGEPVDEIDLALFSSHRHGVSKTLPWLHITEGRMVSALREISARRMSHAGLGHSPKQGPTPESASAARARGHHHRCVAARD